MESFDPVQLYFREIKKMPLIPKEELPKLWERVGRGDRRARKRLVEANPAPAEAPAAPVA